MGRSSKYEFSLGETVSWKGLEGVTRKITVTLEGSALLESHNFELKNKPNEPVNKQYYSVENGELVQSLSNGKVSCKRYFKRKN
ncbi:hypothetical protein PMAYCL1PPCAC_17240, partial [Pristionchus mayeri]